MKYEDNSLNTNNINNGLKSFNFNSNSNIYSKIIDEFNSIN